jgi:hypothetical protein
MSSSNASVDMQQRQPSLPAGEPSQQMSYLFAPFPGQPPPMLAPFHTSNMFEVNNALQGQMMQHTLNEFDGLTFQGGGSGEGWLDTFMGFDAEAGRA